MKYQPGSRFTGTCHFQDIRAPNGPGHTGRKMSLVSKDVRNTSILEVIEQGIAASVSPVDAEQLALLMEQEERDRTVEDARSSDNAKQDSEGKNW
jgi:hypothetical protein